MTCWRAWLDDFLARVPRRLSHKEWLNELDQLDDFLWRPVRGILARSRQCEVVADFHLVNCIDFWIIMSSNGSDPIDAIQ